ncbi:ankyrin repeat domain-containing protein [Flavobacterium piscisymbiosum]|uniref:Ankyrin repeat domain-containing protein n=1 Tax=Flavobacterium piscisymbiosum TaxID=2893753 RepID=A0ABS8MKR0_9FLAO|nr:ankyrin repeat domain-containing protein [Flavobacterium sp. F-30]MCC9065943.1 ankyrin repeat domain-containing protein [Flavobacterium sp. F-30]
MKYNYVIFCMVLLFISCNRETKVDKQKLLGNDYRLFQNTPAWLLAKAVEDNNVEKIKEEVISNKVNINYQESRFGNSLLMLAITNSQYKTTEELLKLGADPNLKDFYRGSNSVIDATDNEDPKYLILVLKYEGNANSLETAPGKEGNQARSTALNNAISYVDEYSLEKVKLLIDAGADINYFNNGPEVYTNLPLADALIHNNMEALLFLLEKGAEYNKVMYTMGDGHKVFILEGLRKSLIELDSKQYKYKLRVVAFLKKHGLNYEKEPIPDYVLKEIINLHPKDWEEYLKKY